MLYMSLYAVNTDMKLIYMDSLQNVKVIRVLLRKICAKKV